MRRILALLLVLFLTLTVIGCSGKDPADLAGKDDANTAAGSNNAGSKASGGTQTAPPTQSDDAKETAAPTETPQNTPEPSDNNIECDWTLHVDDTVKQKTDGLEVVYSLVLIADKKGGTDDTGAYTGTAHLKVDFDASQMSMEVLEFMGGFKVDMSADSLEFNVVPYNIEEYSDFGLKEGDIPLAPLVEYNAMALLTANMSGTGSIDMHGRGVQGETADVTQSASGTSPIPMRIAISGGKVNVSIPALNLSDSFNGMVTGTPK